ncbi:ABC transporter ATP-binding protein [Oscillibacter valericigenes]|uniref:ABC transporter ATP-binding protein n=1 Tax=Oscillibacter valericigenes TaxID=351091 RepID=UPI001F263B87|nr:ABC transporter ATP-binding protein [Oscillibacter valericigenes]MCF2615824.1 ABC transporter ATP-binding protein [Oscillibacter valericigenes]
MKGQQPDRLLTYFKAETWPLAVVTVTGLVYNIGLAFGPVLEGKLAQCLLDIMGGTARWPAMVYLAAVYVGVTVLVQAARYFKRFYVRRFANNVNRSMKRVLYGNLLHTSREELERAGTGNLMTRAISDVDACVEGMRKFTTEVFDTGVALAAYFVLLLVYDWRLALLTGLFPPVAFFLAERMKKPVSRCAAVYKESAGRLNGATLERISGAVTYRVFGLEENRDRAYEDCLADYERKAAAANLWENTLPPLYQVVSMLGAVLILWLGGKNVAGTGWASWDIAAFTAFLTCFTKLSVKTSKAAKLFNSVQKAQVSWKRIKPLLKDVEEAPELPPAPAADLEVSGLGFAYPGGSEVLKHISFTARPGQIIGVTGPVACGKSTLGKAFLCELPYTGSIRFGGRELRDMTEAERASVVGYLGHQPELLSATVKENVLLGTDGPASPWLAASCLTEEVAAMPQGEDTAVGSGGVRLSGGQQARLALARTLRHKRPLLILDDPFSAVDMTTEGEIMEHLRALAGDSIILLLSHRLDRFPELDGVLWMEQGTVLAGSHQELMETCPAYTSLYNAQKGGAGRGE